MQQAIEKLRAFPPRLAHAVEGIEASELARPADLAQIERIKRTL
jgi:hypothetical protein